MTCPPDVALAARLTPASTPPAIHRLLFLDLSIEKPPPASLVRDALAAAGSMCEWMPFPAFERYSTSPTHRLYTALVVRINVLEKYCRALRQYHAQQPTTPVGRDTVSDALSYYMHAWLDAHLLAALAIEQGVGPPADDSRFLAAVLAAYAPSRRTVFHEGELPALVSAVEACSFFSDMAPPPPSSSSAASLVDELTAIFNKTIPRRCGVRNVIANIEQACVRDDGIM